MFSTILGAAKFSGKTKTGWSLGVLESVTDNEYAEIDNNGSRREQIVEPLTNYFVGRAQKDFNNRNKILDLVGSEFTVVKRLSDKTVIKRSGATSPHSGYIYHDKNFLYLWSTGTQYPHQKPLSAFDIYS